MGLFYSEIESCALHILDINTITQLYLQSASYFWEVSLCSITETTLQYLNHCESRLRWTPFHQGFLYFLSKGAVFCEAVSPNLKLPILFKLLECWHHGPVQQCLVLQTFTIFKDFICCSKLQTLPDEVPHSSYVHPWLQLPPECSPNVSTQNSQANFYF